MLGSAPWNSPVRNSYEALKGTIPDYVPQPGDMIIPAASDKPDSKGNPDYNRFLNFHLGTEGMIDGVIPANIMDWYYEAPTEAPLSASAFRAALDTGAGLEEFIPGKTNPQEILAVLGVEQGPEDEVGSLEASITELVHEILNERKKKTRMKSGYREIHGLQDGTGASESEQELEEISAAGGAGGGAIEGGGAKKDEDPSLIHEEEPVEEEEGCAEKDVVIERILNYLLQHEGLRHV